MLPTIFEYDIIITTFLGHDHFQRKAEHHDQNDQGELFKDGDKAVVELFMITIAQRAAFCPFGDDTQYMLSFLKKADQLLFRFDSTVS
jgi:hypothetical protein